MENVIVRMDTGDELEFTGTLLATASREVTHDGRRSTVFEYRLYRTSENTLVVALDTYEKIRARSFYLRFNTEADAKEYILGDPGGDAVVAKLFGGDGEDRSE